MLEADIWLFPVRGCYLGGNLEFLGNQVTDLCEVKRTNLLSMLEASYHGEAILVAILNTEVIKWRKISDTSEMKSLTRKTYVTTQESTSYLC